MSKLKDALQTISNKAAPQDLWEDICSELEETKPMKLKSFSFSISRLAAALAIVLIGVMAVYALSQIYADTGLEGERAERLVTPLNMSITHDDITIRLDWAYMDVSRISIGYTVLDAEGKVFVPDERIFRYHSDTIFRATSIEDMDLLPLSGIMDRWHRYDTQLEQQVYTEHFLVQGFEWGVESIAFSFRVFWGEEETVYNFEFELPVYPALFAVDDIIIENEVQSVILEEMRITQTFVALRLCFQIPREIESRNSLTFTDDSWIASDLKIYFDGRELSSLYPNADGEYTYGQAEGLLYCNWRSMAIPSDGLPQTVRLEFGDLIENPSGSLSGEQAASLASIFREYGIHSSLYDEPDTEIEDYRVMLSPDWWNAPYFEKQHIFEDALAEFFEVYPDFHRIEGHWEIEFELSQPSS